MVTTTRYIYDGNQYLAEADETDTINRLYTNEPDAYTHLISQEEVSTGDTLTYHYDAVGSTRTVTDEAETVTDEFTYDAWGNRLSRTGTNDIPFQYVGERGYYREEATDSYYVMARNYNPSIARWWSMDPLWLLLTQLTFRVKLYQYCSNNPGSMNDPSGLQAKTVPAPPDVDSNKLPDCDIDLCNKCKKDIPVKNIFKILGVKDCAIPNIKCIECNKITKNRGLYDPKKNLITICPNNIKNYAGTTAGECGALDETITHEVIHAANNCAKPDNLDKCRECVLDEMMAHYFSKQCNPGSTWWSDHSPVTPATFDNQDQCLLNSSTQHNNCVVAACFGADIDAIGKEMLAKFKESLK